MLVVMAGAVEGSDGEAEEVVVVVVMEETIMTDSVSMIGIMLI